MRQIGNLNIIERVSTEYHGQDLSVCPECHEPTECIVPTPMGERVFPITCKCVKEQKAKEDEHRLRETRSRQAYGYAWRAYSKRTFNADDNKNPDITNKAKKYAQHFSELKDEGMGLILYGATDKGKTFMASCISNALLDKGFSVVFKSVPQMVNEFQDHAFDSSYLRRSLIGCDLLVLDDWGSERTTEFAQEKVYDIVNARYEALKPMIITTNYTVDTLMTGNKLTVSDDRTRARIMERCLPIEVKGNRSRVDAGNYARMRQILEE